MLKTPSKSNPRSDFCVLRLAPIPSDKIHMPSRPTVDRYTPRNLKYRLLTTAYQPGGFPSINVSQNHSLRNPPEGEHAKRGRFLTCHKFFKKKFQGFKDLRKNCHLFHGSNPIPSEKMTPKTDAEPEPHVFANLHSDRNQILCQLVTIQPGGWSQTAYKG